AERALSSRRSRRAVKIRMKATACASAFGLALWSAVLVSQESWRGYGPSPELPPPETSLIPVVDIAPAKGWSQGETPHAAPDLVVTAFATGLEHPRWLYVLPNGDVLGRPEERRGGHEGR